MVSEQLLFYEGHLSVEGQSLYVDALILAKEEQLPGAIREHVMECELCRAEVAHLYSLVSENQELRGRVQHPFFDREDPDLSTQPEVGNVKPGPWRMLFRKYRFAAALLVLAALTVVVVNRVRTGPGSKDLSAEIAENINLGERLQHQAGTSETLTLETHAAGFDTLLKEQVFAPNKKLEKMLSFKFRSQMGFRLSSPQKEVSVRKGEKVVYSWMPEFREDLVLMVMDNQGRNCGQLALSGRVFTLYAGLPPGLYYWVLAKGKDLLAGGKIYVDRDQ